MKPLLRSLARAKLQPGSRLRPQASALRAPQASALRAPWGWAFSGACVGLLLSLLLCAPAHWLASAVASASGHRVRLINAQGTVWSGSAQLVLTGGTDSTEAAALPGHLRWQLRPLLTGLALYFQAGCCTPEPLQVRLQARWGGFSLQLAKGQSSWPAELLTGLGTPWNTVELAGRLVVASDDLHMHWVQGRISFAGSARLDAVNLSSRLSTLRPLGSYRLVLQGGDTTRLELNTLSGSLQLSGEGGWVGERLRFQGQAQAAPESEEPLSNLLNIIGHRNGPLSIITLG